MYHIEIPSQLLLEYVYTGKFKAPSGKWKHETFHLTEYELFVMTEGTLYITYNEEDFTIHTGEYLILPPSEGWRKGFKESYCSFYWMHFIVPEYKKVEVDGMQTFYVIPQTGAIRKPEKMVILMKQLQDLVKNNYPKVSLNALTTTIIAELYGQILKKETIGAKSLQKQFYMDIMDYVQLNKAKNLKVKDVAAYFGYNEKYLSRLFTENSGMSLKEYIIETKIEGANYMLTDTNESIANIASALGFEDSNNFSRTYKKYTGLTPSKYRDTFAKRMLFHK